MKKLSTDELRVAYLDFFKGHGHAVIPGASLIPENDPTVLFTTAGMHPLVPYLLGEKHPKGTRLVDVQRCVRTIDIEEVGDASHLTFFEMLGNWSLGDYFKQEAIAMSFEFLTKILEIPVEKLAVTCFDGDRRFPLLPRDDESAEIWRQVGIPKERIGFLEGGVAESKKNWWGPAGHTGPCGPDTEMFVWIADAAPQGNPAIHPDGWLEIWNDVFMQYNKTEHGTFELLTRKNVDTGMGLERVAAVMQGISDVYETDRMKPIMKKIHTLCHAEEPRVSPFETSPASQLPPQDDTRGVSKHARIIVDHLRAATFIIADGVEPSNVDQGYVLRKLIRRAIRSERFLLGQTDAGYCKAIAEEVIQQYAKTYSHLNQHAAHIYETLDKEEQQFRKTLEAGLKQFEKISGTVDGETAFHLYDTYGFPIELTKELAAERGQTIDEEGFANAFKEHQKLSRSGAAQKFSGGLADHSAETTKLHTATHLLNAALRKVLGDHIEQKGSNITQERLRFDFNHPNKLTPEQLAHVQKLVNEAIKKDYPVSYHITTVEGAKKEGAIGVFDERYGKDVKVYVIGPSARSTRSGRCEWLEQPFSIEICGGPHVARTGMIGSFKITKEESSSAGIRRIKAIVEGGPMEISVAKEV